MNSWNKSKDIRQMRRLINGRLDMSKWNRIIYLYNKIMRPSK